MKGQIELTLCLDKLVNFGYLKEIELNFLHKLQRGNHSFNCLSGPKSPKSGQMQLIEGGRNVYVFAVLMAIENQKSTEMRISRQ